MDKKEKVINARIYARVSTEMQVDNGISIDTQITRMRDYCKYKQYNVIEPPYIDEGKSGTKMDRKQLMKIVEDSKETDRIIVDDLTRFARNAAGGISLFEQLTKRGIILISLTPDLDFSTPHGKLMFNLMMSFAQMERDVISQKVSYNMKNLSSQNKLRSRAPFGWKFIGKNKDLVIVPEQQKVIQKIKRLHECNASAQSIAEYLNKRNYGKTLNLNKKTITNEDPKFYPTQIYNILKGITDKRLKTIHKE